MKPRYNFFLPRRDALVETMLLKEGHKVTFVELQKDVDAVIFTGGEDVSPILYGEKVLPNTRTNAARDIEEVAWFRRTRHIPKIGICRGAQFLNVMCGGTLYQDVDGHTRPHDLYDFITGSIIGPVTSTHHQMMIPHPQLGMLVAGAHQSTIKRTAAATYKATLKADPRESNYVDAEVVFYDQDKSLCFQPHPEYEDSVTREYFFECINDWLGLPMGDNHMPINQVC